MTQFSEQPHVLHCRAQVGRQCLEKADLAWAEGIDPIAVDVEGAETAILTNDRDIDGAEHPFGRELAVTRHRTLANIWGEDRPSLLHGAPGRRLVRDQHEWWADGLPIAGEGVMLDDGV